MKYLEFSVDDMIELVNQGDASFLNKGNPAGPNSNVLVSVYNNLYKLNPSKNKYECVSQNVRIKNQMKLEKNK